MGDNLKLEFLQRIRTYYKQFQFLSRSNFVVTKFVKTIISSHAAYLTLFLSEDSLSYYTSILLYPDNYRSRITKRVHKGEVNPGLRIIVFSWKGILESLKINQGKNLLIHEFAHALWLESKLQSNVYTIFDQYPLREFEELAKQEVDKLTDTQNHFLRDYAFTNLEEFFAVVSENFFERPTELKIALPHFYDVCVKLYNNDILE